MALAILTAILVITLRLILFRLGHPPEGTDFMLVHFLAIATVVFFTGHRTLMRDVSAPFPSLVREGFRAAALYALLSGLFLWIYFNTVQDHLFEDRVEEMVQRAAEEGHPELVIRPRLQGFFTPFNYATISFVALLVTGAIQALVIGLFHHKVMRSFRR